MPVISGGNVIPGAQRRAGAPAADSPSAGSMRTARATYDFAVNGGAVGTIALLAGVGQGLIPNGAIITGAKVNVITPPTSGGAATVAVQVQTAGDLQAAAAITGAPWSTAGAKNLLSGGAILLTAGRDISIVIATAALTAGKFVIFVDYLPASD